MLKLAIAITAISAILTALNIITSLQSEKAAKEHEKACRKIRDEISRMPLASVELEAIKNIDEHIASIRKTISGIKTMEGKHHAGMGDHKRGE